MDFSQAVTTSNYFKPASLAWGSNFINDIWIEPSMLIVQHSYIQGRKKGNFQGGARSANFGGSGGIFSNMAPHKSIFRAIEGGRRVCQGGRQTILGCQGEGAPPPYFAPLLSTLCISEKGDF